MPERATPLEGGGHIKGSPPVSGLSVAETKNSRDAPFVKAKSPFCRSFSDSYRYKTHWPLLPEPKKKCWQLRKNYLRTANRNILPRNPENRSRLTKLFNLDFVTRAMLQRLKLKF